MRVRCILLRAVVASPCLAMMGLVAGCGPASFLAATVAGDQTVDANYKGLAHQKCAVLVWADNGVLNDFKSIQLDTAKGIQLKMEEAAHTKIKEAEDIEWVPPEQVLQFQQNHPDLNGQAAEVIAPSLGVSRLIYLEVEDFQTHPNDSPDLYRGQMTATMEIVEVSHGKGTIAYTERGINVVAPDKCPPEGLPNLDDDTLYRATLDEFSSELAKRLVPHEVDATS